MKPIVTGGSGFIGSAILRQLDADNYDRKVGKDIGWFDIPELRSVIHLAAMPGVAECDRSPTVAVRENVINTIRVAKHAKRMIFASSAAADAADTVYGVTKQSAEKMIRLLCPNHLIVRISNVYGPGSLAKSSVIAKWCKDAMTKGEIVVHGDGTQRRDFIYVDDVAENLIALLETRGIGTHPLATGISTSLNAVADMVAHWTGAKIRWEGQLETRRITAQGGIKTRVGLETGIQRTLEYFANVLAQKAAV